MRINLLFTSWFNSIIFKYIQTKLLTIFYDFVAGPKYVVSVESGLGKEKGLEILSLFVNMKKADLPEQAHSIIKECKGRLFCV